jgi:hypothetical protein
MLVYAALAAIVTAVVAAIATRVQLLPDVIDVSIILTGSGLGSLVLVSYGALRASVRTASAGSRCLAPCSAAARRHSPWRSPYWPMYSRNAMWRALAPYLLVAALVSAGAGAAYGLGAPAWIVYAAIVVAVLAVLPGYERWDRRQHPH